MDMLPLEQAVITAAAAIVSACGVVVASYIRAHVKNSAAQSALAEAVALGAGIAHDALTTAVSRGTPDWAAAKAVAIQQGTAAAQKVAAQVTSQIVTAALAPLLAVDPSAPAGLAATATATASKGQEAIAAAIST